MENNQNKKVFRAIWISDFHLGTKACDSEKLFSFLSETHSEYLYLVGDIMDLWNFKKWYWPQTQNNIMRKLLKETRANNIIYLPGNHDEFFKELEGIVIGNIVIKKECVHVTSKGFRFLIFHGDEFDFVIRNQKWLAYFGSMAYEWLMKLNFIVSFIRKKIGREKHWSLAEYMKKNIKNVVKHIGNFETIVVNKAKNSGVHGIICGHLHTPNIKKIDGTYYLNSGDWIDNLTAIVETMDGDIELITYKDNVIKTLIRLED